MQNYGRYKMKYRELTPNEIEAYNIGYKNGSRQSVIKVLEYETPEEKIFYRQGYNAGCQDRKRHNVSTNKIVSNVSNVDSYDSTIANNNNIVNNENKGGMGGKGVAVSEMGNTATPIKKPVKGAFVPPTEEEFLKMAKEWNDTVGMGGFACTKQQAIDFWLTYDSQDWIKGNGQHITNIRSAFRRWLSRDDKDDTPITPRYV